MRSPLRAAILTLFTALAALGQTPGKLPAYVPAEGLQGTIRLTGSDSIDPLVRLWTSEFQKVQPGVEFAVKSHGSATAPPALIKAESDIGHMSRAMEEQEAAQFTAQFGYAPTEVVVAYDALAIYVNRRNPIRTISIRQLDAIYGSQRLSGVEQSIDSWKAFGFRKRLVRKYPVKAYTRDENSGSRAFFMEKVLQKGGTFKDTVQVKDQLGIMESIGREIQSIGYGPESYWNPSVRMVPLIGLTSDKPFLPTLENIQSGRYALARTLRFYVNREPGKPLPPAVKAFLEFVVSDKGQSLVKGYGSAPLTPAVAQTDLARIR